MFAMILVMGYIIINGNRLKGGYPYEYRKFEAVLPSCRAGKY